MQRYWNAPEETAAVLHVAPDGTVELIDTFACGGQTPRGLAIDPSGRFLVAALQDGDAVVSHRIDPDAGTLIEGNRCSVPTAASVTFLV